MFRNRWYTGNIQKLLLFCWIASLLLACSKKPQSTERPGTPLPGTPSPTGDPKQTGEQPNPGPTGDLQQNGAPGGVTSIGETCYFGTAMQLLATIAEVGGGNVFSGSHINNNLDENTRKLAEAGNKIIEKINNGEIVEKSEVTNFFNKLQARKEGERFSSEREEDLNELMECIYDVLRPDNYIDITPIENSSIAALYSDKPLYILPLTLPNNDYSPAMQLLFIDFSFNNLDRFKKIPDLLTLNVNRNLEGKKNKTKIQDPLTITINETHTYELVAFARHCDDGSSASGHYIAYVKRGEQWFRCNNAEIEEKKISDAVDSAENSDVFLYKKSENCSKF
ncbi:MAG: ubiquitin carboxyl-terminal hydrolase [Cytophagales bacterium]|nr:ubiquitin carboxyl-terminal hydrolase [Cytophagales bacterium]